MWLRLLDMMLLTALKSCKELRVDSAMDPQIMDSLSCVYSSILEELFAGWTCATHCWPYSTQ